MAVFEFVGWIEVLLSFCGLGLCIRYSRLSDRMIWLVFAFGLSACTQLVMRMMHIGQMAGLLPPNAMLAGYSVANVILAVGNGLLIFGLFAVFQEVRERFHFIREAHESRTDRSPRTDDAPRGPVSGVPGPRS